MAINDLFGSFLLRGCVCAQPGRQNSSCQQRDGRPAPKHLNLPDEVRRVLSGFSRSGEHFLLDQVAELLTGQFLVDTISLRLFYSLVEIPLHGVKKFIIFSCNIPKKKIEF